MAEAGRGMTGCLLGFCLDSANGKGVEHWWAVK